MEQNAMRQALENPLILQTVLKKVKTQDLLNCRLVTYTNWYDLSTQILSRRKDLRISFFHLRLNQLASEEEKYQHGDTTKFHGNLGQDPLRKRGFFSDATENPWPLSSLTEFIKNSSRFPFSFLCRRFRFSDGYIEDENFANFIEVYGGHIVDLELDLMKQNFTHVIEILGQVLVQLPNLEALTIGQVRNTDAHLFRREIHPFFQMPRLTSVRIGPNIRDHLNFLNDLRSAAPNLQTFKRFFPPYSESEVENWIGRMSGGVYSFLKFDLKAYEIDFYENLARSRPKFEVISLLLKPVKEVQLLKRVTSTLTRILNVSRNTLKQLHNIEQLDLLPNFQIPRFTQVRFIDLKIFSKYFRNQGNGECFPTKNLNFPRTFPTLKGLRLESPSMDMIKRVVANNGSKFDPVDLEKLNGTPTTTVTYLEIAVDCPNFLSALIPQLGQTFPMVQKLEIVYHQNFLGLVPEIWTSFPKLVNFFAMISTDKVCTACVVQKVVGSLPDQRFHPNAEFSTVMYHEIDVTLEIQKKWRSPSVEHSTEKKPARFEFHSTCADSRQLLFKSDGAGHFYPQVNELLPRCIKGSCIRTIRAEAGI